LNWSWGHQMAFVDWTGRQTKTVRESFMVGTSGEIKMGRWFLQNYILMNHLAHPAEMIEIVHIKDHFGYSFLTGINLGDEKSLHVTLKAGILASLYRERSVTEGFLARYSFHFEGLGAYHNFAIKTTLHSGEKLQFALGDPFYRFSNYLRTDAVWNFINHKRITGRFNWSFHWTNHTTPDHSQQLSLIYRL
jgi:hypothetical protein